MDENKGHCLDWDSTIENDGNVNGGFVTLPEGNYPFTVTGFERSHYNGGAKIPPCNMAVITMEIDGAELGTNRVTEKLYLHSSAEWKLCAFFTSIGQRKHGEKCQMNWMKVTGAHGRCKLGIRTYTKNNGEEGKANTVLEFLEPKQATFTPGAF